MDSTIRGIPLTDEPLGALTLGGFLREVCAKYGDKEALVFHPPGGPAIRLTYAQVWDEACTVARALIARGVTKETRVGLLATNRPEWITAMFGVALAGGTCVAMSTFAKSAELEYQLRVGDVSAADLRALGARARFCGGVDRVLSGARGLREHRARSAVDAPAVSATCRVHRAMRRPQVRSSFGRIFCRGPLAPASLVDAIAAEIAPTDRGLVFFSSGSTAKPKAIVHAHRAAAIQCWRWRSIFAVDTDVRTWTANGFFWSGNFAMAIGATFAAGGCLVLQRHFAPGEALKLMQTERVSLPLAWPHQWARAG